MMELDFILSPSELPAYFLAVKYVFAVLFGLWLLVWFRWGAPWILVGGAIFFCLFFCLDCHAGSLASAL